MAAIAVRVCRSERVVVIDVAVGAGVHFSCRGHLVRTHQRPSRRCMVERNVRPQRGVVAGRTIRRGKGGARRRMRRVIGLLPRRQVASGISAIVRLDRQVVVVVDVAVGASIHLTGRRHLVRIGEREPGGAVIKVRGCPRYRVMTGRAGRHWKDIRSHRVLGIGGLLPGCQVTLGISAIRSLNVQVVVAADVAILARNVGVSVGQRKINRWGSVVQPGSPQPTVKCVAGLAGLRKLSRYVIGVRGFLEIRLVAGNTSRRESLKLADGGALVAVFTLGSGVRA